jgi:hypothetical protein
MNTSNETLTDLLINNGVSQDDLDSSKIREYTVLYCIYWANRLKNNPEEQAKIVDSLSIYLGIDKVQLNDIINNPDLIIQSQDYILNTLTPTKSIDLLITKSSDNESLQEFLTYTRGIFPAGLAIPGGLIIQEDYYNPLGIRTELYAALRVAGQKVLHLNEGLNILKEYNDHGAEYYSVSNGKAKIVLEPLDERGYEFKENIKSVLRPSDPRHIVDTIGFKCHIEGDYTLTDEYQWTRRDVILSQNSNIKIAFNHHRELIAQLTAQTSLQKEMGYKEYKFIRSIVDNPVEMYNQLQQRFLANENNVNTSMPELFPVVNSLLTKMYDTKYNEICIFNTTLAGIRDKATISLRHCSLIKRVFCPYLPTVRAVFEAIAFFDIVARERKSFYSTISKDKIEEHNPRDNKNASYHMYRYKYRLDDMLSKIPQELIIPTFESFSATDLIKVRCVPIRFVGLSTDFLYVDEFEQSPEEFLMHDVNHSWRMMNEDRLYMKDKGMELKDIITQSHNDTDQILQLLRITEEDTKLQLELKKIKEIILFEVIHEDARPLLKDLLSSYIQLKEGGTVPFEVPRIDPVTGYMDVVDTLDTGISTLSYVRNKLQYGFYDHVDAQSTELVDPNYRSSNYIAQAAYEFLIELGAKPTIEAAIEENGNISYDWLLKRVCAVGPDNIHNTDYVDPLVIEHGDGAQKLNPKRYQA